MSWRCGSLSLDHQPPHIKDRYRVNERICQMTGYSVEELIGQKSRILYVNDEDFEYVGREKYR